MSNDYCIVSLVNIINMNGVRGEISTPIHLYDNLSGERTGEKEIDTKFTCEVCGNSYTFWLNKNGYFYSHAYLKILLMANEHFPLPYTHNPTMPLPTPLTFCIPSLQLISLVKITLEVSRFGQEAFI